MENFPNKIVNRKKRIKGSVCCTHAHTQSECHSECSCVCVFWSLSMIRSKPIQSDLDDLILTCLCLTQNYFSSQRAFFCPFYFVFHLKLLFVSYSNDDCIGCVKHIRHTFCLPKLHVSVCHQHRKSIFHKTNAQP